MRKTGFPTSYLKPETVGNFGKIISVTVFGMFPLGQLQTTRFARSGVNKLTGFRTVSDVRSILSRNLMFPKSL